MPNPFSKNFDPDKLKQFMDNNPFAVQKPKAAPMPQQPQQEMPMEQDQEGLMKKLKLDALRKMMMGG